MVRTCSIDDATRHLGGCQTLPLQIELGSSRQDRRVVVLEAGLLEGFQRMIHDLVLHAMQEIFLSACEVMADLNQFGWYAGMCKS